MSSQTDFPENTTKNIHLKMKSANIKNLIAFKKFFLKLNRSKLVRKRPNNVATKQTNMCEGLQRKHCIQIGQLMLCRNNFRKIGGSHQ